MLEWIVFLEKNNDHPTTPDVKLYKKKKFKKNISWSAVSQGVDGLLLLHLLSAELIRPTEDDPVNSW